MSAGAQAETSGPAVAGVSGGEDEAVSPPDRAGRLLARLSVLPALLAVAWLLAGLPLLLAGVFTPVLMLVVSVPLAVLIVGFGLRWIPAPSGRAWPGPLSGPRAGRTPWWTVAAVVAIAVAFGVDQMIYHSQFIIVMRDPASYINFGSWISGHHSLPIPQDRAAFGGSVPGLSYASFAYYQVGSTAVVPQFMAGLPMVLSSAFWVGGVVAAVAVSPVLGALAVLTFGGLAARLVGPRWAPLAALVLAVCLPEQFTGRSDYSEPLTQILFLAGLCLVVDSLESDGIAARVIAALGGLALGLTLLVRIDGASDILPLVPYCGLLLLGRRRQVFPLAGGLIVGGLYGVVDGMVLSRPYLGSIKSALIPLLLVAALVVIVTLVVIAWRWKKGVPQVRSKWLLNAAALLPVVVVIGYALRPYVQTVRAKATAGFEGTMVGYQHANHLAADPTRLYYELSLHWVFWYIGVPAVIFATVGAAVLARRCATGNSPAWTLPLVIFAWTIVTTLYDPAITPDQPWASRRLVPAVLPGFILLAVWAISWIALRLRMMRLPRLFYLILVACCLLAMVVPAVITTFGLRPRHGGPVGIRVVARGLAFRKTYEGEIAAVNGMCAAIPRDASVVFISGPPADRLAQIVRGMCGNPSARINHPRQATVENVVQSIVRAGRRPVLLADSPSELTRYGGQVRQVMRLRTTMDGSTLTSPPLYTWGLTLNLWMSEPSS
jgi:hypothetical protein